MYEYVDRSEIRILQAERESPGLPYVQWREDGNNAASITYDQKGILMVAQIIDLQEYRESKMSHWADKVYCISCGRQWVAVAPVGTDAGLECPDCGKPTGTRVE